MTMGGSWWLDLDPLTGDERKGPAVSELGVRGEEAEEEEELAADPLDW